MRSMSKSTYGVFKDEEGREYVEQVASEVDKNHAESMGTDETTGEGRMYDQPESSMCPVKSYKRYVSKLHPELDALWQHPRTSFLDDEAWYCKMVIGANSLNNFMSDLSMKAALSDSYTNHSIRATSITIMDQAGVEARHIMRVTGHK